MVHINNQSVNDEPRIAFGGEKSSGIGRFGRHISFDEFTAYQWVFALVVSLVTSYLAAKEA